MASLAFKSSFLAYTGVRNTHKHIHMYTHTSAHTHTHTHTHTNTHIHTNTHPHTHILTYFMSAIRWTSDVNSVRQSNEVVELGLRGDLFAR